MPQVEALEHFRRGRVDCIRLYVDDGRMHEFDAELAVKFQWVRGFIFNEADWNHWIYIQQRLSAIQAVLAHLSLRKKSAKEAREWLLTKGFSEEICDAAVEEALQRGYLDDQQYAQGLVNRRQKAGLGPEALQHELLQRGLAPEVVADAVAPFESWDEQRERALELGRGRMKSVQGLPAIKQARRLADFLARKGYSEEVVTDVVQELVGPLDEENGADF